MSKFLEIFKAGRHIDSHGQEIEFSAADVEAIANNYNPEIHEAPIVVGHPKNNAPAFGWIKGLVYDAANKILKAIPSQLNPDFVEAVKSGAYKKISASLYAPDSPNNPAPGQYSLRHVGFLGAQPPAIKGLAAVEFAEDERTVDVELDFADIEAAWNDKYVVRVFRSLKNFLIDKFSQEEADAAIPEYGIEEINVSAEKTIAEGNAAPAEAAYSEPEASIAAKELAAEKARTAALEAELSRMTAEKQAADNADFCDKLIREGRLLPAQKAKVLSFMNALPDAEIEFSETERCSNLAFFKEFLSVQPVQVNFEEVAAVTETGKPDLSDPRILAQKAVEYQEEQAKAGKTVSISAAVRFVKGEA